MRQISATELAKLGKCERQVYLDCRYGEDTALTAKYIHKGNAEHEQFNRRLSGRDNQGFIRTILVTIGRWIAKLFRR